MSSTTIRNNINLINSHIGELLKKQAGERKKEVDLNSKINDLHKRMISSSNQSTIQSYQRQIDTKSKELVRAQQGVANYHKKVTDKQKELARKQDQLTKELERESKKKQSEELKFLREKEKINKSELNNIRSYNSELAKQQNLFNDYSVSEEKLSSGEEEEYSLSELNELHHRIDAVLDKLEKLGFGQELIFNEIDDLKSKSKKVTKKDLKMMLIGKIVSFGAGKIDTDLAAQIFEEITLVDLTKLIQ